MKKKDILIMEIAQNEGITTYDLSKKSGLKYINTNLIVNKLEKEGLIHRIQSDTSKLYFKPKYIYLTDKGKKYVEYLFMDIPRRTTTP